MMIPLLLLLVPTLPGATTGQPVAQQLAFHGVRWHVPADSVRAPLQAQGFTFSGVSGAGDHEFTRADGARLNAEMRDGRLIGFTLADPARGEEQLAARFQVLADSLRTVLGAPDEADDEAGRPFRLWDAGLSWVRVEITRMAGDPRVQVAWRGPGWLDEMERRNGRLPQPPGFTTVRTTAFVRIAVDTTVDGPRAADARRGRFRIEYFQPITPTLEGVEQDPLDTVEYEMDFDCAGRRARLIARATFLEGRWLGSNRSQRPTWTSPLQPDGHYARGLEAVCRAARGRVR